MFDAVTLLVLGLLVVALVASVVPGVPAGLVALLGVYVAYFFGPNGGMSIWLLLSFTVVGVLAVIIDLFGGAVTARAKGASSRTTLIAAVVGLALFFVAGPVGVVLGMFGTVLAIEIYDGQEFDDAWDTGVWATAGMLASGAAVFFLVLSMLVGYVVLVMWWGSEMMMF